MLHCPVSCVPCDVILNWLHLCEVCGLDALFTHIRAARRNITTPSGQIEEPLGCHGASAQAHEHSRLLSAEFRIYHRRHLPVVNVTKPVRGQICYQISKVA